MAAFNIVVCISIVCFVGALAQCPVGKKKCGTTCCLNYQLCEESESRCYANNTKVDCQDGISYCYKPTTCCGVNTCCEEGGECCGLNTCCPTGAVCCGSFPSTCCPEGGSCCGFQGCCGRGDVCQDGECHAGKVDFHWWYVVIIVVPLILMSACIIQLRKRRMARLQAAQNAFIAQTTNQLVRDLNQAHAGYDQPAYPPQPNMGYSQAPPPYSTVNAPRA